MGLFSKPKPVKEMHIALDELLRADKEYQRAVKDGDERAVEAASRRFVRAQDTHDAVSKRTGGSYWK